MKATKNAAARATSRQRRERAIAAGSATARRVLLGHLDLDHVRRPRDVHRRARGDDDALTGRDEAGLTHSVERARPEVLDVLALRDLERCHAPLERHLLERVAVVREADDRAARAQPRDGGSGLAAV